MAQARESFFSCLYRSIYSPIAAKECGQTVVGAILEDSMGHGGGGIVPCVQSKIDGAQLVPEFQ